MKLKIPKLYSQRDPQWAPELLGYNTNPVYSIGGYGCLITSFGMYIDKTPHEVNEILKANNGYTQGSGNFIWSKCTVLGLTQVYQSPYYSDPVTTQGLAKMRTLLDEGRPLITHIDFDPRDADDDQHWILVYGYDENDVFYARDPWTGTEINLDVYGGVKRCVYEWRAYDLIMPRDETQSCDQLLNVVRVERDRNWDYFVGVCTALGVSASYDAAVAEARKLVGLDDALVQKDRQLQDAETRLADLELRLTQITADKEALQKQVYELSNTLSDAKSDIELLKKQITTPVFRGWKKALVDLLTRI